MILPTLRRSSASCSIGTRATTASCACRHPPRRAGSSRSAGPPGSRWRSCSRARSSTALSGGELLGEVRQLHPHAKRALLVGWGEWGFRATGDAILEAIEHGKIDHYVVRPVAPPDELFHHAISTFLLEWAEERRTAPYAIHVVGDSWSGRAAELRTVLRAMRVPARLLPGRLGAGPELLLGDAPADAELPVVDPPGRHEAREPDRRRADTGHGLGGRAGGRGGRPRSSSAPDPRACRQPCTAHPRGSARWSSTSAGSADRPGRAR